ncbi:hypothetical protein P154DRAFT_571185 [Amniculicola lignicola CBS 123094]|uniref:Uncharacterized protein n=1 Tax=Amniculicola lignicola CBS 123094 TaxID=1392246 RepID=A0A6A5WWE6_9PLEO|nr:hypothetical protein P154DRAFT_571185 [Amniculicola lignicola CBS 123094]
MAQPYQSPPAPGLESAIQALSVSQSSSSKELRFIISQNGSDSIHVELSYLQTSSVVPPLLRYDGDPLTLVTTFPTHWSLTRKLIDSLDVGRGHDLHFFSRLPSGTQVTDEIHKWAISVPLRQFRQTVVRQNHSMCITQSPERLDEDMSRVEELLKYGLLKLRQNPVLVIRVLVDDHILNDSATVFRVKLLHFAEAAKVTKFEPWIVLVLRDEKRAEFAKAIMTDVLWDMASRALYDQPSDDELQLMGDIDQRVEKKIILWWHLRQNGRHEDMDALMDGKRTE